MMPIQMAQQLQHMQAVNQQQVPNQSQQPPQAQQPPSQTQQTSQTPHLQPNQQFISAHAQPDQNQRNVIKQRESSLFNSYVYDFLKRSGAHETARTYLREGENLKIKNDGANSISGGNSSSDNNVGGPLPDADVPVQAPEGFLYEWWTVFWDIYSVKLNRQGTMEAQRYVAERRGNRMMGQIPTMNAYQNPQVVQAAQAAQVAQAAAVQQQQMRIMQQMPQHPPQQAQQTSQQTVQQQQQQAPSQPSQPPQQPQQTPQPQPQPSPANHQPQPFNNRQMPNGVIDNNTTNGDMHITSPQRKMQQQRRNMSIQGMQIPQARNPMLAIQQQQQQHQHQALQNNAQTQAVQSQAQNSQPIQSQQNSVVNQQVQQQAASHMTPNQAQAQLNAGTKRGVEPQAISQSMSMQATSPNKRQKLEYSNSITGQRQQQQPTQPGQMAMSSNMMLTTPVSNEISSIASPDLKNRQSHLAAVKKNNSQIQQMPRGPQQSMTPMNNKPHVNQQMPMVQNIQNTVAHGDSEYMNQMNQIHNQINKQINASNQSMQNISQNISSFIPVHQGVRIPGPYMNMMGMQRKMPQNTMLHIADKQRNINELGQQMVRPVQHLYMLQQQMPNAADVGPNNNSAQQMRKNEVKVAKNGKTTPTQSQQQVPNGNVSNVAAIQQPVIPGNNEVPQNLSQLQNLQTQLPTQTPSTALADGSLEMNMDEVNNYLPVEGDLSFEDYLNFEHLDEFNDDQLGSSSNAGPSNGN